MTDVSFLPSASAEELLRRWIGLDPHSIGEAAIRRAVRLRMLSLGLDDVGAFMRLVESDRAERDRLVEEVVVAESWFFRDPQVYDHLRRFVSPRAEAAKAGNPLRILSAPCAAGEEPYSIAMTLLESGLPPEAFRIDAVDVSHVALTRAHAARYSPNAFRNADGAFRERWFRMEGGSAVLDEKVRGCVRFAWGNVLEESFVTEAIESGRAPYDVVFCRNLLIYLTPVARAAVERSIDRLLKPEGVVVLGAAEPAILRERWIADTGGSTFTLRRTTGNDPKAWSKTSPLRSQNRIPGGMKKPSAQAPGSSVAAPPAPPPQRRDPVTGSPASKEGSPTTPPPPPAAPSLEAPPIPDAAGADGVTLLQLPQVLEQVNSLANARRFSEAIALCEAQQRLIGPSAELYFLAGIVHQACGALPSAEDCFQKTLYLDAGHEDALLALSLIATQRGDLELADQYRRSARRVLERKGAG